VHVALAVCSVKQLFSEHRTVETRDFRCRCRMRYLWHVSTCNATNNHACIYLLSNYVRLCLRL